VEAEIDRHSAVGIEQLAEQIVSSANCNPQMHINPTLIFFDLAANRASYVDVVCIAMNALIQN